HAQLLLLHAVYLNLSPYGPADLQSLKSQMRFNAGKKMTGIVSRAREASVDASSVIQEGKPAGVIVDAARQCHADLIVLAHHQHRGLNRMFRQRTAEQVVRQANCPVLVLEVCDNSNWTRQENYE